MPYQKGKLKGQLTTAEIRKLISAHNKLSKITIPPRSTREQIMDILDKNGFSVDHEKELLVQKTAKKMDINLEKAKEVTKRQPKAQPKPKEVLAIKDKPKEEKKKPSPQQVWDSVRELKWNSTIITKLKLLFGDKKIRPNAVVKDAEIKNGKLIVKYVFTKAKAEQMADDEDERKRLMTEPQTANFNIPGGSSKKADKGFKVNRSQRTKVLNEWNDERFGAGLKRVKLHPILGIKASEETLALVKEKCKELRLRYHPDKNNEPDQEKFDMVQRACKILLDTQEITK